MPRAALDPRLLVGAAFCAFQYWILAEPQLPMVERPAHLVTALVLLFLWLPFKGPPAPRVVVDGACLAGTAFIAWYYWAEGARLASRMDNVDPVFPLDAVAGVIFVLLLLEGVRRAVGLILVAVLGAFLLYGFLGHALPGAAGFRGFGLAEAVEILTMTTSGILGVTTETSVSFVFYFVAFAIQSNLVLKFAAGLMTAGGDSLGGALLLVVLRCIVMGMGLPTVAAYIIGAILFAPALQSFGVAPIAAHFFVMYYCVLSMVTPPVVLASYAAAGLAGDANAMRCGLGFFGAERVMFASDFPFDAEGGAYVVRETIAGLDSLGLDAATRARLDRGTLLSLIGGA